MLIHYPGYSEAEEDREEEGNRGLFPVLYHNNQNLHGEISKFTFEQFYEINRKKSCFLTFFIFRKEVLFQNRRKTIFPESQIQFESNLSKINLINLYQILTGFIYAPEK
jgi:hypothetical protein